MNRAMLLAGAAGLLLLGGAGFLFLGSAPDSGAPRPATPIAALPIAPAQPAPAQGPAFDVVRIEPDGRAVLAGRAAPGAEVTILDGDAVIGTVTADGNGDWVYLPDQPLPPGGRELRLRAVGPDGAELASQGSVVLVVPEPKQDIAGRQQGETGDALALLTTPDGASRVLQGPAPTGETGAPRPAGTATLDSIDYDQDGRVSVGGQGKPGGQVMLYLDNGLVGRGAVDAQGRWSVTPDRALAPGSYTLRVDQVGPDGKVDSRAEVAFDKRPIPADALGGKAVVVLPGNNLWAIARRSYGEGPRYTTIFQANQEQIRDPDLIYPGQIFIVPAEQRS